MKVRRRSCGRRCVQPCFCCSSSVLCGPSAVTDRRRRCGSGISVRRSGVADSHGRPRISVTRGSGRDVADDAVGAARPGCSHAGLVRTGVVAGRVRARGIQALVPGDLRVHLAGPCGPVFHPTETPSGRDPRRRREPFSVSARTPRGARWACSGVAGVAGTDGNGWPGGGVGDGCAGRLLWPCGLLPMGRPRWCGAPSQARRGSTHSSSLVWWPWSTWWRSGWRAGLNGKQ